MMVVVAFEIHNTNINTPTLIKLNNVPIVPNAKAAEVAESILFEVLVGLEVGT